LKLYYGCVGQHNQACFTNWWGDFMQTKYGVSTNTLLQSQQIVVASCNQQVSVFIQGVKNDLSFDKVQTSFANSKVEAKNSCIFYLKKTLYTL
jgi:hypothetical protein